MLLSKALLCPVALLLLLLAANLAAATEGTHGSASSDVEHHEDNGGGGGGDSDADRAHDHESFLGHSESGLVDKMSPEESKKKLEELIAKIDRNGDAKLSEAEMKAWLTEIARKDREQYTDDRFVSVKTATSATDLSSPITLDDWKRALHSEMFGDGPATSAAPAEAAFSRQFARDLARWEKADANGDKKLNRDEFASFLYAEHSLRMKDVLVAEALNTSDANRDGRVDLPEYMLGVYPKYTQKKREGKPLPDWVVKAEEVFKTSLDLNKDGSLDAEEVYRWTVNDIDSSGKETEHLFDAADDDKDKMLSKDEVMKNWQVFVGHKATHFGEFGPRHEEL